MDKYKCDLCSCGSFKKKTAKQCKECYLESLQNNKKTLNECKQIALKYNNRSDFQKFDPSIFHYCRNNRWISKVCEHMLSNSSKKTKEECKQKAILCTYRFEFKKRFKSYYKYAQKKGWLKDICSHMPLKVYGGGSKNSFQNNCKRNSKGIGTFYIIHCYDEFESFYKAGITSKSIKSRYGLPDKPNSTIPYCYSVVFEFKGPNEFIYDFEKYFLEKNSKRKYIPQRIFHHTECFSAY